jgi:ribonuclease HI
MSNPSTLAAAQNIGTALAQQGLQGKVVPSKNEWLAKIETDFGPICIYTNAKRKVSIQTHEIKNPLHRALVEDHVKKTESQKSILPTGAWTVYTDGSAEGGQCGWSAIVFTPEGNKDCEQCGNLGPQPNNQIAGELEGAIWAIQGALTTKTKKLIIRHDYEGVGHWGRNQWKHRDPDAARLKTWVARAKAQGLTLEFEWQKGHNGDPGNERADQLAGEATKLTPTLRIPNPQPTPKGPEPEMT